MTGFTAFFCTIQKFRFTIDGIYYNKPGVVLFKNKITKIYFLNFTCF